MVSPALEGKVLTTGRPGKSREVTFIHSTNLHPFHGVPVPIGLHVLGRPAAWLARGRPWQVLWQRVLQGAELHSGKAGGDQQTRLLAVSPG